VIIARTVRFILLPLAAQKRESGNSRTLLPLPNPRESYFVGGFAAFSSSKALINFWAEGVAKWLANMWASSFRKLSA